MAGAIRNRTLSQELNIPVSIWLEKMYENEV